MAFWSNKLSAEPLRQHRWYIEFNSSKLDGYRFALKTCTKPEYDIGISEHVLLNHTFRYPKNLVWKPITIKMIAVAGGTNIQTDKILLTRKLYSLLNSSGYYHPGDVSIGTYINPDTNITKNSLSKEITDNHKFISIVQIDSNGNKFEQFSLYYPIINNIKFGSLSYDSENFVDIDLSITYDYANIQTFEPDDSGLNIQNIQILGVDTGLTNPFTLPSEADRKRISPGFPNGRNR